MLQPTRLYDGCLEVLSLGGDESRGKEDEAAGSLEVARDLFAKASV